MKRRTVWCYLNEKKHCDVVQVALDKNIMVTDAKKQLIEKKS